MSFIKHPPTLGLRRAGDAPRTLLSFIWATAVMLTIFFAVILSSFFVLKHYYPVSASEVMVLPKTADCDATKNQSQIAINNYPGEAAITAEYAKTNPDDQHGPVEKALGGDYQCSVICVPGIDQKKPVSDPTNLLVVKNYLVGATIGGKPILADVPNGTSFVGTVKIAIAQTDPELKREQLDQLKRIVIIPYSKATICAGNPGGKGQSVPYAKIITKDKQEVKEIVPNDTKAKADLAQAQQKAASEKADAVAPEPIAGPAEKNKVSAPVATNGGTAASSNASPDLKTCSTKVNNFLYKYETMLNQVPSDQNQSDPDITRYGEIRDSYLGLKKAPYLGDEDKSFNKCLDIEKLVDKMTTKLWGTKTELALCKKTINNFLAKYPLDQTQSDDLRQIRHKVAMTQYNIKYLPWYWVSAERQLKVCNEALPYINKYKIAMGATGPLLTDSQLGPVTQEQANAGRVFLDQQEKATQQKATDVAQAAQYALTAETEAFWTEPKWNLANFGLGRRPRYTWKIYNKARGIEATLLKNAGEDRGFWIIQYKNNYYYFVPNVGRFGVRTGLWTAMQGKPDLWKLDPVGQVIPLPTPFIEKYYQQSI